MLALVRIALRRPYTFVVLALLILIFGTLSALRTPTDIFPDIRIPVISVVWPYTGLPADQMEKIFELFHRLPDAKPGGTGLGLTIVRGFVEAQGGRVRAGNRPGGGAVFTVTLPMSEKFNLPEEIS